MRCPLAWGSSLAVIGAVVAALAGCATPTTYQSAVKDEWPHFGHDVAPSSVETVAVAAVVATEVPFLVEGTIKEVCQTKGCWMVVADGSGHDLLVRFQDYGFFVPRNAMGRRTVIHGVAEETTYSVEILQHLASDAGKSSEEIAAPFWARREREVSGLLERLPYRSIFL